LTVALPSLRAPRLVLADLLPGTVARDGALVVGAAALVGLAAQITIALPFTPVPLTLQPFAVLLAGATLGVRRGTAGMLLYLLVGLAGMPWFAQQTGGTDVVHGASFGYLLGFVAAAALVGALAARGFDRTVPRTVLTMALGVLTIYAIGLPWLMVTLDVGLGRGLALGVTPFLLGDAVKVAVAAALLPTTWRLVRRS